MNEVAVGRPFSPLTAQDLQPVWNEERTQFIVMAGKVFGYEEKKADLIRRGHDFRFERSGAEFILHSLEEWGDQCLDDLNGVFAFACMISNAVPSR